MKFYQIKDKEAGNVIVSNLTLEIAELTVKQFEDGDKYEGEYIPDFYEIKEMDTNEKLYQIKTSVVVVLEDNLTLSEAEEYVKIQEEQDRAEDEYIPDSYLILEMEN